jgi:hypothetical protein
MRWRVNKGSHVPSAVHDAPNEDTVVVRLCRIDYQPGRHSEPPWSALQIIATTANTGPIGQRGDGGFDPPQDQFSSINTAIGCNQRKQFHQVLIGFR